MSDHKARYLQKERNPGQTTVTNTTINQTLSAANGDYRLNDASPTCPSGCPCTPHGAHCTLHSVQEHIDETVPADYTAVTAVSGRASAPSPGVVVIINLPLKPTLPPNQ